MEEGEEGEERRRYRCVYMCVANSYLLVPLGEKETRPPRDQCYIQHNTPTAIYCTPGSKIHTLLLLTLHTGIHDIPTLDPVLLHDLLRALVPLPPPHERADRL